MFLAHTFLIDTLVDSEWNKMYYDPKEYENLISYFSSPIFNAFLMMENFYEAKEDVFKVFRIEDERTSEYLKLCLAMFKKDSNKIIAQDDPIGQDSKAKTSPPCEIDFIKLQDNYCIEVSQCFNSIIALIYLENDMSYAKMYPILKSIMSSKYLKSYPLKD
jgi:hypothetical protein